MKRLLATLLIAPTLAHAAIIASTPNEAGGKIYLTDTPCEVAGSFKVIATVRGGKLTHHGCFTVVDNIVAILWSSGDLSILETSTFQGVKP